MISQLTGTVTAAGAAWFVIDVGGVGFRAAPGGDENHPYFPCRA